MRKIAVLGSLLAISIAGEALAAEDAYDDASDPAYDDDFQALDNGGFGWGGGWISHAGLKIPTIGSSTVNGAGDPDMDDDIDVDGESFRFATGFSGGVQTVQVSRLFGGALAVGDTFTYDFDHDEVSTGGYVSLDLLSVNLKRFGLGWYGSNPDGNYAILDAGGSPTRIISLPLTDEKIHVAFTLTGTNTYQLEVTPDDGSTLMEMGTLAATGAIDRFRLSVGGDGNMRQSYFNSFGVNYVPEPAAALGGCAAAAALVIAKRRRS